MSRILVISPNVSDAVLGCSGMLVKHVAAGDDVRLMILGDGITSRARSLEIGLQAIDLSILEEQGRAALAQLGIYSVEFFRLPDNRLDQVPLLDLVKTIEATKIRFQPDVVYTTSDCDLGIDQKRTCLATVTAFRPQPGDNQAALYAFEVRSSTEWNFCERDRIFLPDTFVDISSTLQDKLKAFQALTLEQRQVNHARSVEAIVDHARLRGSHVGLEAAEAFMLLRAVRQVENNSAGAQRCVLAVVAHPDDETLGCGGALAAWAKAGAQTHVLCLADGETARFYDRSAPEAVVRIAARREAARKSVAILGLSSIRFLDFPDNRLDGVDLLDVIRPIEALIRELKPDTIYTHHGGDLNLDHRVAHQAVTTACRPLPGRSVQRVYSFETPSSTDWATESHGPVFRANLFVDISAHLGAKIASLQAYDEEMHPFPHPRSLEGVSVLARQRGACVGVAAAEAFMLVRELYASGTPSDELSGVAD